MLSLKQQINEIDVQEQRFRAAFTCYLAALTELGEHALDVTPEITRSYRTALRTLHRDLFEKGTIQALESGRAELIKLLETFRSQARTHQTRQDADLRSLIGSLASAADSLTTRNDSNSQRFKTFILQLQDTASLTDLDQIKRKLDRQVEELREADQGIWEANRGTIALLETKLAEVQTKLAEAEKLAATDALTGLLNRGGGEAVLRAGLADTSVTGVLMIDLNGFKQINDRWGHECGDQVLQTFSRNLEQLTRPGDSLCRWGGDEFLVMLRNSSNPAEQRPEALEKALRARYRTTVHNRTVEIDVSASVGAAQAVTGQKMNELIAQADGNMYTQKKKKPIPINS